MIDPATVEVIRNSLRYSAEEMGVALRRSAYSHNIVERMDHSCALLASGGQLLAQAEHIPVHLGSLPWGARNVMRAISGSGGGWDPGDLVVTNDPYIAGTHLNDVTVVMPVFSGDELLAFCVNKAHHVDVGGIVPGSISCSASVLEEEGVVIPPVKLLEGGNRIDSVLTGFLNGVRDPRIARGDLRAQIASARLGHRRIEELIDTYGPELLTTAFTSILDQGERAMKRGIDAIGEGAWSAEDCIEDVGADDSVWIRTRITCSGGEMVVDFEGTDPQVEEPLNAVFGVTVSAVGFAVKSIADPSGAMNGGSFRPLTIRAPEGCLVNPVPPAPVAGGNLETSQRIADVVFRALADGVPEKVPAACQGSMNNVMIGGERPDGSKWTFYETIGGGSGGRAGSDGVDAIQCNMTNTMNTPIEAIERYYPLFFEEYGIRRGTGGKGRWKGGDGIKRRWSITDGEAVVTILGDRRTRRPWGLAGGEDGEGSSYSITRADGAVEKLGSKVNVTLRAGDALEIATPGGGGYGSKEAESQTI